MENKELDDAFIDELLEDTKSKQGYNIPGTNKRRKYDDSIRTVSNWFKLPHTMTGECQIESHDSERLDDKGVKQTRDKPRMFYQLPDGRLTCRWCFVEKRDEQ